MSPPQSCVEDHGWQAARGGGWRGSGGSVRRTSLPRAPGPVRSAGAVRSHQERGRNVGLRRARGPLQQRSAYSQQHVQRP